MTVYSVRQKNHGQRRPYTSLLDLASNLGFMLSALETSTPLAEHYGTDISCKSSVFSIHSGFLEKIFSRFIRAKRFGGPGRFGAEKLIFFYREPSAPT